MNERTGVAAETATNWIEEGFQIAFSESDPDGKKGVTTSAFFALGRFLSAPHVPDSWVNQAMDALSKGTFGHRGLGKKSVVYLMRRLANHPSVLSSPDAFSKEFKRLIVWNDPSEAVGLQKVAADFLGAAHMSPELFADWAGFLISIFGNQGVESVIIHAILSISTNPNIPGEVVAYIMSRLLDGYERSGEQENLVLRTLMDDIAKSPNLVDAQKAEVAAMLFERKDHQHRNVRKAVIRILSFMAMGKE